MQAIALMPSRPASKPALTCFVLISMVSRYWSSRLALRPASNFVSSYIFFVCCNFHNLESRGFLEAVPLRQLRLKIQQGSRVIDLEASIRQLRQLSCILDSCTISASYEVSQAQKALLLLPHTDKGTSTSSEELNAQISPRTDEEHNLP